MGEDYVSEEECKRRREASCCGVKELIEGLSCQTDLLKRHDVQAAEIGRDVDMLQSRMEGFEADLRAATNVLLSTVQIQNQAAKIMENNVKQAEWNQAELTEYRKAMVKATKQQGSTVRAIALKMGEIALATLGILAGLKVTGVF